MTPATTPGMVAIARTLVACPAARYSTLTDDNPNPRANSNDNQVDKPRQSPST